MQKSEVNLYETKRKYTHIVAEAPIYGGCFLLCALCENEESANEEMERRIKEEHTSSRKYICLEIKKVYDEEYSDEILSIKQKIKEKLKEKKNIEQEIECLNRKLNESSEKQI